MTLGAVIGYALASRLGRPFAERFVRRSTLLELDLAVARFGPAMLVLLRPLPVLAEASVLLAGTARLAWSHFLFLVGLSNLGIAAVYAWMGRFAESHDRVLPVLFASIVGPLAGTLVVRWLMARMAQAR